MDKQAPICPYCNKKSQKVSGDHVYPHRADLHYKVFYVCDDCDARVGCHPGTDKPLGRLADADLRKAKQLAHGAFDPLWRDLKLFKNRKRAYSWLANKLGIESGKCHIGMFNEELCRRTKNVSDLAALNGVNYD
jgi:hypothetical protein